MSELEDVRQEAAEVLVRELGCERPAREQEAGESLRWGCADVLAVGDELERAG